MSTTLLIGRAKELYVATLLVGERLHVYLPLVDNGFDLLVTSSDGTKFLPVQVKYKNSRTGFSLKRADVDQFVKANAVIAFGSGTADLENFYFFPAKEWVRQAEDRARGDDKLVVYMAKSQEWAARFKGSRGIHAAFKSVLPVL